MPCSCNSCLSGIKGGPAQKVAICDLDLVECGAQIPGLGDVTGTIETSLSSIASPSAQDITDVNALNLAVPSFVDAYTTWSTGRDNILLDDGVTWDIGDAANTNEGLFRVNFSNPFAVCETTVIELLDFLFVYEAIPLVGGGVDRAGIWVLWRKANNDLVPLVELSGTDEHNVPVRLYVPAIDTITVDDLVNGYGLVGMNLYWTLGSRRSQFNFDYIGARFQYDATSCYDPASATGGTRALPVSVVCNSSSSSPVNPSPTIDWGMEAGTLLVPNGGNATFTTNPNMHVMSIYNPGVNELSVNFETSASSTARQIVPPSSNYTFGIGDDYLSFGTEFTVTNDGASDITIIWNASTTGG